MADTDPVTEAVDAFRTVDPAGYPRPQLRRAGGADLCGTWGFAHDDADRGIEERWFDGEPAAFDREIIVPFPPESAASGLRETRFHPIVWYRRSFEVAPEQRAGRLLLHFGAVDYRARVWVNGRLAAEHEGGHTSFSADITQLLVDDAEQLIVVRAEDRPTDLRQPRGKQFWREELRNIWYYRTTGIWQPVWLEAVPRVAIAELHWTADLDRFGVQLTVRLDRPAPEGARLRVRLRAPEGHLIADDSYAMSGRELRRMVLLDLDEQMGASRLLYWTPGSPHLIDAEIELVDGSGTRVDRVESYFGLRSVEVRDGRIHLNGAPIFMRLVLAQNYWPESHLAAPSPDALRREVEAARELGFNGLRIHQKIEDPRFLYWCDRLGMMVWAEAANAYVYDDQAAERLTREWLEAVRRDRNHPCIVAWVPLNESWGVPNLDRAPEERSFVKALYHLTKALDQTRPVIGNDGWQHAVGDIFGVHDYAQDPDVLRARYGSRDAIRRTFEEVRPYHFPLLAGGHAIGDEAVVLSEFGGITFKPGADETWFGYETADDAEALLERYRAQVDALLDSTALAGFCYTQLTDTEQETNGLLTAAREHKLDPDSVRAINTRPSGAVPSEILHSLLMQDVERRRRTAQEPSS
jgi:beta-galactosidase/beta-glucuronidase